MIKIEKVYPPYVSISYPNREKQVILVMIPNGEGWHYLALKKTISIIKRKTVKRHGDFYCLHCLYSFAAENKRKFHKKSI